MDKTEFIQLEDFEPEVDSCPDSIIEEENNRKKESKAVTESSNSAADDLLDSLGI